MLELGFDFSIALFLLFIGRQIDNLRGMRVPDLARLKSEAETLLETLVNINSTTSDVLGVTRVQTLIAEELRSLGFKTRLLENPDPTQTTAPLLLAELRGLSEDWITLVSHADTVLSVESTGPYRRSDETLARGSGVIDNKGGLVVALTGLRLALSENDSPLNFGLRLICSPNEEGGSTGFHEMFRTYSQDSKIVLGFEPALSSGSIIESRRGNRWYALEIEGEEAHAGRCRGEELNAAHELAQKIVKLQALNNRSENTSVNVGHIEAGRDRFNVVCGFAKAKIDARFASFESRDRLHSAIESILLTPTVTSPLTGRSTRSTFKLEDDCPPFSATPLSQELVSVYLNRVSEIEGRDVRAETAGGAGDVNHMSRPGVVVIDGLGPIGANMHTLDECISLPSLATRSAALAAFLEAAQNSTLCEAALST